LAYGFAPKKILRLALCAFDGKYDEATVKGWLRIFIRRFMAQQFKRSCMPDGPKVCDISLSPRGGLQMPSDATARLWLDSIGE
jgi:NAD+ synthase (glutamine-hydrolysing)